MEEKVILVDVHDKELGTYPKLQAHKEGLLHRALSVFIFNAEHEMLIHKRAEGKYHSGGLWTNACCSHPRPGEPIMDAAMRRLPEEMGITCDLKEAFCLLYHAQVGPSLVEHEFDHVFIGTYTGEKISPDPSEVAAYRWINVPDLLEEMSHAPKTFTAWFHLAVPKILALQQV
jgi:isopentenyl-diphosphate Delta-isomerase